MTTIDPEPFAILGPQPETVCLRKWAGVVEDVTHLERWMGTKVRGIRQEAFGRPLIEDSDDPRPLAVSL